MKYTRFIKRLFRIPVKIYYKLIFKRFSFTSVIKKPLQIDGAENITIGEKVFIGKYTWLAALPLTCEKDCNLKIGKGSTIGHFNHIYATKSIIIEENVLTADKVFIADSLHSYENPDIPVLKQPVKQSAEVVIGEGSWLGENVCVFGAKIGKHCVIGANSVVTKDIPDYCVAVGAPAKVIKRYNFETKEWEKCQ